MPSRTISARVIRAKYSGTVCEATGRWASSQKHGPQGAVERAKGSGHAAHKGELKEDLVQITRDGCKLCALRRHCRKLLQTCEPNDGSGAISCRSSLCTACAREPGDLVRGGQLALLEDTTKRRDERLAIDVFRQEAKRDAVVDECLNITAHQMDDCGRELPRIECFDLGTKSKVDQDESPLLIHEQICQTGAHTCTRSNANLG